ncbi:MAG: hypothetical protein ACYTDT_02360 [Planctomycetota bacterium]|jgi:hypothetical protein
MRYLPVVLLLLTAFAVTGCVRHRHGDIGNTAGSNPDPDHRGDRDLLGSRKVNLGGDVDRISARDQGGKFRAIEIEVDHSALSMYDIEVHFMNGDVFSPTTRLHFGPGSWSRKVDLPGNRRKINYVEFHYRSKNIFTGRATVKLWGVR